MKALLILLLCSGVVFGQNAILQIRVTKDSSYLEQSFNGGKTWIMRQKVKNAQEPILLNTDEFPVSSESQRPKHVTITDGQWHTTDKKFLESIIVEDNDTLDLEYGLSVKHASGINKGKTLTEFRYVSRAKNKVYLTRGQLDILIRRIEALEKQIAERKNN